MGENGAKEKGGECFSCYFKAFIRKKGKASSYLPLREDVHGLAG